MNSVDYWLERSRADKLKVIKRGETGIKDLKRLLLLNLQDVNDKITQFYDKYSETPNEELTHTEFERYKKELRSNVKKYPKDKTLKRILKEDAPKYRIDRLTALKTELQVNLAEITEKQEAATNKILDNAAVISEKTANKTISNTLDTTFTHLSKDRLNQIVNQTWVGRKNWSSRIWADRDKVGKKLTNILERGSIQGTSLQKMSAELQECTNNSFNNCFRIIRTETSHIDAQVKLSVGQHAQKELGERLKYKYDAFLDDRTSKICRELNDKVFWLDDAKTGVNLPPMHPNCRSTYVVLPADIKNQEVDTPKTEKKEQKTPKNEKKSQKTPEEIEKAANKENKEVPIGNEHIDFDNIVEVIHWRKNGKDFKDIIAKDIQTAQKIAETNGVIVADFSNMSLEYANEINKALLTIPRNTRPDYITDAKTLLDKGFLVTKRPLKKFFGVNIYLPDSIKKNGKYVDISNKVAYNSTIYKNFDKVTKNKIEFNKKIKETAKDKTRRFRGTSWNGERWYFNTDGKATIYHELAHAYAKEKEIPSDFEPLAEKWFKESNIGQIESVSEAWAEAFAGYHTKNPELPTYLKEYFERKIL